MWVLWPRCRVAHARDLRNRREGCRHSWDDALQRAAASSGPAPVQAKPGPHRKVQASPPGSTRRRAAAAASGLMWAAFAHIKPFS